MRKNMMALLVFFIIVLGFVSIGFSSDYSAHNLEVKKYKGISYVSGGLGTDERQALKRLVGNYRLQLAFAVTGGKYLYKVAVTIKDTAGKTVLEARTDGPWLFADLPAGEYTVSARNAGQTVVKKVQINGKGRRLITLHWKR